jgi:uncharacterized protein DUF5666
MKRSLLLALSLIGMVTPAFSPVLHAEQSKTARGTVTALATDTVTVKVRDTEMTFMVGRNTLVEVRGGSHKTAAARAAGMAGPKVTDLLKMGDPVSISYDEAGGGFRAARILVVSSVPANDGGFTPNAPASRLVSGTVTAAAADRLTISAGGEDMTFTIGRSTHVVGTGIGTKVSRMGGRAPISVLLSNGDRVSVRYYDANGTRHAARVQVTQASKAGTH